MLDLRDTALPGGRVMATLDLQPHPEYGTFGKTWRDLAPDGKRGTSAALLYLPAKGDRSHWCRTDATELRRSHASAQPALDYAAPGGSPKEIRLSPNLATVAALQAMLPPEDRQATRAQGPWPPGTCTVALAFTFNSFELAPAKWAPGDE